MCLVLACVMELSDSRGTCGDSNAIWQGIHICFHKWRLSTAALIIVISLRENKKATWCGATRRRDGGGVRGARMRVHVTRFAQTSWSRFYQASISDRNSTRGRGRGRVSSYSERPRSRDHRLSVCPRPRVCRGRAHTCVLDTRGCALHIRVSPTTISRIAQRIVDRTASS